MNPSEKDYVVADFMTPMPHGIDPNEPLSVAEERMVEFDIRHLPVRRAGTAVGIISDRDLAFMRRFKNIDFKKTKTGEFMIEEPYCVSADMPLAKVAAAMAEQRIGSALVVDKENKLTGIFTYTDALKALSQLS